jgi:hypothetical protein
MRPVPKPQVGTDIFRALLPLAQACRRAGSGRSRRSSRRLRAPSRLPLQGKKAYRLGTPEAAKYKQVVLLGTRRTRRECNQLSDADLIKAQDLIAEMSRKWEQLPVLPDSADAVYSVPEGGPVELTHRGLPLDEIEDLLLKSAAYRQAARILAVCRAEIKGRPVTPLHGGHVALCAIAGLLDGVFGSGEDRHIATWRSVKVTDCSEEVEEDGTIIRRERERFTNELNLLYASGKTAILR